MNNETGSKKAEGNGVLADVIGRFFCHIGLHKWTRTGWSNNQRHDTCLRNKCYKSKWVEDRNGRAEFDTLCQVTKSNDGKKILR